jgi:chemotaxis protein methyltransferase CheR
MTDLRILTLAGYKRYLAQHPGEWHVLDSLCTVTISRFYRDRTVFGTIGTDVLPFLAGEAARRGDPEARCWSIGCCRGEEAYTLEILWTFCVPPGGVKRLPLRVIATDSDGDLLKRAREGSFRASSLKDLPEALRRDAFERAGDLYRIRDEFRENVEFLQQDIRTNAPPGVFHLILCRNLVFTYHEEKLQQTVLAMVERKLVPGGILVIGARETLPEGAGAFTAVGGARGIYRTTGTR